MANCPAYVHTSGFLSGTFSGGRGAKSIAMLIFLLFLDQFFWGGAKVSEGAPPWPRCGGRPYLQDYIVWKFDAVNYLKPKAFYRDSLHSYYFKL